MRLSYIRYLKKKKEPNVIFFIHFIFSLKLNDKRRTGYSYSIKDFFVTLKRIRFDNRILKKNPCYIKKKDRFENGNKSQKIIHFFFRKIRSRYKNNYKNRYEKFMNIVMRI